MTIFRPITKLKACPMCGHNEAEIEQLHTGFSVICNYCLLQTAQYNSEREAVEHWNTRAGEEN